eukprot:jgi/Tetstr1/445775/TSEL_033422.t1
MDQDKTRLSHLVPWDKDVEKKDLLQCRLTCVKYNGSRPDDVYYVFDCFPHDSSNTITVMYKTAKKEIERLGEALDTVWFQFDNAFRENNSNYSLVRYTAEHGHELILCGVPGDTPAYVAARPLYNFKADPTKAFAEMEKEIWNFRAADMWHFSSDGTAHKPARRNLLRSIRELETSGRSSFNAFWPEATTELDN